MLIIVTIIVRIEHMIIAKQRSVAGESGGDLGDLAALRLICCSLGCGGALRSAEAELARSPRPHHPRTSLAWQFSEELNGNRRAQSDPLSGSTEIPYCQMSSPRGDACASRVATVGRRADRLSRCRRVAFH